jgi:signal-transduction protein with cAMP-binding, CBS, and nucleotidyltransferase domain
MSDDVKFEFLQTVPLFKGWENVELYTLANALQQRAVAKGEQLINKGTVYHELCFIVQGRIDVVRNTGESLSSIECGSYFGESGLLTAWLSGSKPTSKFKEKHSLIALSKLKYLALDAKSHFLLEPSIRK